MISVVILAKNDEKGIVECIESVKWSDEIIVIDDNSTDGTEASAKKLGALIYRRSLDDFSSQRNFGLSKASGEWVLFVDADERISDALAFEISNAIHQWTNKIQNNYSGFYIKRSDFLWGKQLKYGEAGGIKLIRLAKKSKGEWKGRVHEKWIIQGNLGILKNPINHYPHQTISNFLKELNWYTTIRAKELYDSKSKVHWWSLIVYPIGKFLDNYLFKKGFLDGDRGLIIALIMSLHSFLVRGKLWQLQQKKF